MNTYEKVKIIFIDVLQCEDYDIYPETHLQNDLCLTERIAYEIYNKLQEVFQVKATIQEAKSLIVFQDAVDLIESKLKFKGN